MGFPKRLKKATIFILLLETFLEGMGVYLRSDVTPKLLLLMRFFKALGPRKHKNSLVFRIEYELNQFFFRIDIFFLIGKGMNNVKSFFSRS